MTQHTDSGELFTTDAQLPTEIVEIYMTMQTRVFEANQGKSAFNHAMYSRTPQEMQDAYAAGFEMANRLVIKGFASHQMLNPAGPHILLAMRNSSGIGFATGVASKA